MAIVKNIKQIEQNNRFWLKGDITRKRVNKLIQDILACSAKRIVIFINSGGGDYENSKYLHSFLTELHDREIVTVVVGDCCSGAILVALAGDERWATPLARFMIHGVTTTISDELAAKFKADEDDEVWFGAKDYEEVIEMCQAALATNLKDTDEYYKLITQHCNLTVKKIKAAVRAAEDNDWYFPAKEALKYRVVDNVGLPPEEMPAEPAQKKVSP